MANCGDGITKTTKGEFTALILRGDGPNQVSLWMEAAARTGDGCIEYYVDKAREVAKWNSLLLQGNISHMINMDALWQRREQYFGLQPNPQKALTEANAKCAGQPVSEEIARRSKQLDFSKYASHWQSENVDLSAYTGGLEHQPQQNINSAKQVIPAESRRAYGQQRRELNETSATGERQRQAQLEAHRQQVIEGRLAKKGSGASPSESAQVKAEERNRHYLASLAEDARRRELEVGLLNARAKDAAKRQVENAAPLSQPQWTAPVTKRAPIVPNHDQLDEGEVIQGEVVYTPQHGHLLPSPVAPRALPPPSEQVPVEKSAWQRLRERNSVRRR